MKSDVNANASTSRVPALVSIRPGYRDSSQGIPRSSSSCCPFFLKANRCVRAPPGRRPFPVSANRELALGSSVLVAVEAVELDTVEEPDTVEVPTLGSDQ